MKFLVEQSFDASCLNEIQEKFKLQHLLPTYLCYIFFYKADDSLQEENCAAVGDSELRHCLFQVEVKGSAITVLPEIQKEKELLVNATPPSVPLLQSSHELPDCVRAARKRQLPDSKCNSGIPPYGYLIMQIWLGGWMRSYQVCMHTSRTAQHKEA